LALKNGIRWVDDWQNGDIVMFDKMPKEVAESIRILSKGYQNSCEKRKIEPKHKYAYVLGQNKAETRILRKLFNERNKIFPYPKERGK